VCWRRTGAGVGDDDGWKRGACSCSRIRPRGLLGRDERAEQDGEERERASRGSGEGRCRERSFGMEIMEVK
jgi:hypothetical protein